MSWLRKNWKWLAGAGCAVGTAALAVSPAAPLAAITGPLCAHLFGSAYHEGQRMVELADPIVRELRDAAARRKLAEKAK